MKKVKKFIQLFLILGIIITVETGCDLIDNPGNESPNAETVRDIDGNEYKTVKIGDQVWMAENLRTTTFNDGTPIPAVVGNEQWGKNNGPGYCWYDNDEIANNNTYGVLYNWYAISNENLCPPGWHIPSAEEWDILASLFEDNPAGELKETGTVHWETSSANVTNSTGFTALPGGLRSSIGRFEGIRRYGVWWTTTEGSHSNFASRTLYTEQKTVQPGQFPRLAGLSVRLVKD